MPGLMESRDNGPRFRQRVPRVDFSVPCWTSVPVGAQLQTSGVKGHSLPELQRRGLSVGHPVIVLTWRVDSPLRNYWQRTIRLGAQDSACGSNADGAQSQRLSRLRFVLQGSAPDGWLRRSHRSWSLGYWGNKARWMGHAACSRGLLDNRNLVQHRSHSLHTQAWIYPM